MLKVLIVDDHALVRAGMERILCEQLAPVEVTTAADVDQMLAQLERQPPDVVLLDISLPGRSGLDGLAELRVRHPRLPVLVVTMQSEEQFAVRALRAGASGYLSKERAPEELIEGIHKILAGGRYVSGSLAERWADELACGHRGMPHERLSARELEVLLGLAGARGVSEIADALGLSVKTVSTYRARILDKMGLRTNAELMQYAMRQGLIG